MSNDEMSQVKAVFTFTMVPNIIIYDPYLDWEAKAVYIGLLNRAMNSGEAFPSIPRLADDLKLGQTTIRDRFRLLEAFGLLKIERRFDDEARRWKSNLYTIVSQRIIYGELVDSAFPSPKEIELKVGKYRREILTRLKSEKKNSKGGTSPDEPGGGDKNDVGSGSSHEGGVVRPTNQGGSSHEGGVVRPTKGNKKNAESEEKEKNELQEKEVPPRSAPGPSRSLSISSHKIKELPFEPEDLTSGIKWLEFARGMMPWNKTWSDHKFATSLAKIRKATGMNHAGIAALLEFVRFDEFWAKNAISPDGLLKKSKGGGEGVRKIDLVLVQMRKKNIKADKIAAIVNSEDPF